MLAFDIETAGLDPRLHSITCVCVYDPEAGIQEEFVFELGDQHPGPAPGRLMAMLDAADRLCAFNGVRFDLPFIARRWAVPDERLAAWMCKLVDVFEMCKLGLNKTFPLNRLLAANGMESKTGTGMHAVHMAARGEWAALAEYCMQDTVKTHAVTSLPLVLLPGLPFACRPMLQGGGGPLFVARPPAQ